MSYRSSSPISGFAGHIPGNKWHVGGRQSRPNEDSREESSQYLNQPQTMQNGTNFSPEQLAQMYQQQMAQFQSNGQLPQYPMMPPYAYGFNPYLMNGMNGMNGISSSGSVHGLNNMGAQSQNNQSYPNQRPETSKSRSKSLPRKQPKSELRDMFGGIESGWWSEGQALKNLRRHQQGLQSETGSNSHYSINDSTVNSITSSKRNNDWDDDVDVPTPGYSGHVPGIKQYGVGKPFTVAAKEARRIMHSGNDSTQISSSSAHSAAIKAKNSSSSVSSQSNGHAPFNQSFASNSQNPFMQSYPYGMMPMFMNNMQQMPVPQTPQKP
ncbi:hypothetical protein FO519_000803 [Halicephalobus sp. NKZ332]|nr:hypothetical protein FO519_000803 [Halicephalobus sp. NKZ332]